MSFFYSTDAGFVDFIILIAVCSIGMLSRYSRLMAGSSVVAFLAGRTAMALRDEAHASAAICLAFAVVFMVGMVRSETIMQRFHSALFIPIMGLHFLVTAQVMDWDSMTTWWVLILAAQMILILGGAAHGGMAAMGRGGHVGSVADRAAGYFSRLVGRS
jgi:hypothetical protein